MSTQQMGKNLNVAIIILLIDIKIQVFWLYIFFISTVVGWIVVLKKIYDQFLTPRSIKVTLLGKRAFVDIIKNFQIKLPWIYGEL